MIKVYLKQAWELLKQNKLFSMLYIVGTGLAIAMTMIMAVVYYVKIAPVYPEANRMNTLYLSNSKFTQGCFLQGAARLVLSRRECSCRFSRAA